MRKRKTDWTKALTWGVILAFCLAFWAAFIVVVVCLAS